MSHLRLGPTAAAAILGCAGLMLVGWTGLLVPSLIRSIEHDFGQTDAGIGVLFFVGAVGYVAGTLGGGLLTERFGRRIVISVAVVLVASSLAGMATVPTWELFVALGFPFGLASGAIDSGSNGLILDLYPASRGRALNLLHLFFSLGALASPLVVGRLADAGVAWQPIVMGTAVAATPLAVLLLITDMPSGRHASSGPSERTPIGVALPVIALAVAIACYVGSEVGVSNWLVRFLDTASVGLATSGLALFWGCLTLGRLVSAKVGDRFDHARFAASASLVAAIALAGAVVAPSVPASIVLFGVVGFAFGPVYPLIMAVAGDRFPGRSAAVSGYLAGSAAIGAIIYPPVMGFVSVGAGLGAAMGGAAALSLGCATVLFAVGRRGASVASRSTLTKPNAVGE
jgi:OFA family oxalate/formate antiporter-like MFS transporter